MKAKNRLYLLTILVLLTVVTAVAQPTQDILSNESVTTLFKKGLGSGIIINKIKTTKNTFDVSTDALIKLKNDGIPDEIVSAMIESIGKNKVELVDLNDPRVMRGAGIYHYNPAEAERRLSRLDPTVVSAGKSGGFGQALAAQYTYGLANSKVTSILSGANSRKQLQSTQTVFYFYFDHTNQSAATNWWFNTATSPNEFALVKLTGKKDSREFVIGKANSYGSSIGIDEKQKVQFAYEEVAAGIYKIIITGTLKAGEYCFVYTGATPSMYSNDKVFDFGAF